MKGKMNSAREQPFFHRFPESRLACHVCSALRRMSHCFAPVATSFLRHTTSSFADASAKQSRKVFLF